MKKSKNQELIEESNPISDLFNALIPDRKERNVEEPINPEDDPEYKMLLKRREARLEAIRRKAQE